jgi:hypothetical protein
MDKDLFQMDSTLTYPDRVDIITKLESRHQSNVYCSACDQPVVIEFLRKRENDPVHMAMCLPCFLNNHTDASQEDIDRLVKVAEQRGWYIEYR